MIVRTIASLGLASVLLCGARAGAETVTYADRPSNLVVPATYDPEVPTPLILLLHGYSSSGAVQDAYMGFSPLADEFDFLLLNPDGLVDDFLGNAYWNGTDACCDFDPLITPFPPKTDDSGYLRGLIEEVRTQYNVDPHRIFVTGHSNGGFMSYRMACDHADVIAAIASLAGATYADPGDCSPSEPIDVLQIHGTLDGTIAYAGDVIGAIAYPGAVTSVETWNAYNGCTNVADTSADPLDIDILIADSETTITRYTDGCDPGGSGELWTIETGGHVPALAQFPADMGSNYSRSVIEYFYAHPKVVTPSIPALPLAGLIALAALLGGTGALWTHGSRRRALGSSRRRTLGSSRSQTLG